MAFTNVTLKNPTTGHAVIAPVGFSWTAFLFGFWVPLLRGDWPAFGILFGMFLLSLFTFSGLWALPAYMLIPVLYNRNFIARKVQEGYQLPEPLNQDLEIHQLTNTKLFPMTPFEKKTLINYAIGIAIAIIPMMLVFMLAMAL